MSENAAGPTISTHFDGRSERERAHYNRLAERVNSDALRMPRWNIDRYRNPGERTVFPLEYAFHLMGDLGGKTVLDLGCGDGLNTVILASLGAKVLSVDISDTSLEVTYRRAVANGVSDNVRLVHSDAADIPLNDSKADRVLCAAILHHVDPIATARQIHRILKPGGIAVFEEPMTGPAWVGAIKKVLPKNPDATDDERPLTLAEVHSVSSEVGRHGRSRYFGVMSRITDRFPKKTFESIRRVHQLDAWLLNRLSFTSAFASPLVWEARKE